MARCWPMRLPAVPKFVLVSLADQANDQAVCWPSIQTLADRTGYSVRAVQNALRWLEEKGLLDVEIGAMRANRYTLRTERYKPDEVQPTPAGDAPPAGAAPLQEVHPPRRRCTPPPQEVHPNRNRTINTNTPPIPPEGGGTLLAEADPVQTSGKTGRVGSSAIGIGTWIERCRADGVKPIPPDDPIWSYCERVGITEEMLVLHWGEFKRRHLASGKRQSDWRRKLRNSVEGNWYRLWFIDVSGACQLTTQGRQAQKAKDFE